MLARLTIAPIQAGKTDEVERIFREKIGPALRGVRGFSGGYALTNRELNEGVSFTLWESEEEARAYEESGKYRELLGLVSQFFAGAPELKSYEISVEMPAALHV